MPPTLSVYLPEDLYRQLVKVADREQKSIPQLIREVLGVYIEQKGVHAPGPEAGE